MGNFKLHDNETNTSCLTKNFCLIGKMFCHYARQITTKALAQRYANMWNKDKTENSERCQLKTNKTAMTLLWINVEAPYIFHSISYVLEAY